MLCSGMDAVPFSNSKVQATTGYLPSQLSTAFASRTRFGRSRLILGEAVGFQEGTQVRGAQSKKLARSYSCAPLVQHVTLSTHLDFLLDILLITSNKALLLCSTRFATRFGMETRACTCELTAKLKKKHTIAVNRNKQSSFLASGSKQARANNAGQSC